MIPRSFVFLAVFAILSACGGQVPVNTGIVSRADTQRSEDIVSQEQKGTIKPTTFSEEEITCYNTKLAIDQQFVRHSCQEVTGYVGAVLVLVLVHNKEELGCSVPLGPQGHLMLSGDIVCRDGFYKELM